MAEPCRHRGSAIPWPSPQGHPLGQGTPYRVPDQPFLMIPFDVLTCLKSQTTSESDETRTVVSVSKIASQRFENHVDTTSVLREKPRKPKGYKYKYLLHKMIGNLMGSPPPMRTSARQPPTIKP